MFHWFTTNDKVFSNSVEKIRNYNLYEGRVEKSKRNRFRFFAISSENQVSYFRYDCRSKVVFKILRRINQFGFFFQNVIKSSFVIVQFLEAFLQFTTTVTGIELLFSLDTDSLGNFVLIDFENSVNNHIPKSWKE